MVNIPENAGGPTTYNEKLIHRPWNDVLAVNKAKWTEKHDAGSKDVWNGLLEQWVL